jgi:hypothetical protein
MTGPFLRVQESRQFGPTWVNVAQIVKIQQSSKMTTVSLAGAGMIQIEETAEAFIGRITEAVAGIVRTPQPAAAPANRARQGDARPKEVQHG